MEPALPETYDDEWLEIAREIEDAHEGMVIVNPRNLQARSLIEVDRQWLADMNAWRKSIRYWKDYEKRPAAMK